MTSSLKCRPLSLHGKTRTGQAPWSLFAMASGAIFAETSEGQLEQFHLHGGMDGDRLRLLALQRLNVTSSCTSIVQASKGDEEESGDIDIVDVDEEEEESLKKAMGVGEFAEMPPGAVTDELSEAQMSYGRAHGHPSERLLAGAYGTSLFSASALLLGTHQASSLHFNEGTLGSLTGHDGLFSEGFTKGHGHEGLSYNNRHSPLSGGLQFSRESKHQGAGVHSNHHEHTATYRALYGEQESSQGGGEEPDIDGGCSTTQERPSAFDLSLNSAALEEELNRLPIPDDALPPETLSTKKRRKGGPVGGSAAAAVGADGENPSRGVTKKTRQRTTRPAPVASFFSFMQQQEELPPVAQPAEKPAEPTRKGSRARRAIRARGEDCPIIQFSLRSIVVPELCVSLPEDATVGALKEAVAEATMSAFKSGARLRMLVQGVRVSEDDATLAEMGLSQADPDLSFMMEVDEQREGKSGGGQRSYAPPGRCEHEDLDPSFLITPLFGSKVQQGPGTGSKQRRRRKQEPATCTPPEARSHTSAQATPPAPGLERKAPCAAPGMGPLGQASAQGAASLREEAMQQGDEDCVALETSFPGRGASTGADPLAEGTNREPGFESGPAAGSFWSADATEEAFSVAALEGEKGIAAGLSETAIILHPAAQAALSLPSFSAYGRALVPRSLSTSSSLQLAEQQRRIRRPFNVDEVATLVEAVEVMGSRELEAAPLTSAWWREVKDFAFADHRHRTSVDLKDKWKTLVHTAQIAPHQRRGAPVPQDLLDRVLQAHALWTDQRASVLTCD